ncbi:MAG: hypothetical protein ISS47_09910 [Candidatus Omnitrophica bacterium]|nr:hypothetical protein [Candidatus Omnitrophota bacterium]
MQKKRPVGVIIFGMISLLISVFWLIFRSSKNIPFPFDFFAKEWIVPFTYALISTSLLLLKNWTRRAYILSHIFGIICIGYGVFLT